MKLKTSFLALLITFIFLTQAIPKEVIKIGYFNLPPHTYENAGKPSGSGVVLFEMLASKMGYEIEWVGPLPLPRLTEYLKDVNGVDGTFGFPKYPSFQEFLHYTDKPVYMAQATFAVASSNPIKEIKTIKDIEGFSIGLVKSSSGLYTPLIDNNKDKIKLEELGGENWMEQNLNKLLSGRLNAIFDRQVFTMTYYAKKLNIQNKIK